MPDEISASSRVVVTPDQVSADLGGEAAILSFTTGICYGLDDVGARVWGLIHEPRRVAELRDLLSGEYEVTPTQVEADLIKLLQELRAHDLIVVQQ